MKNTYRQPDRSRRLPLLLLAVVTWTFGSAVMSAQQGQSQSPRAQQVQLSGLPQGNNSASLQQSASSSTTSSVNTINTTVQVQGAYQGSVLGPVPGDGPISLTFAEAIQRGLQYNLGALDSLASLKQARAQRLSALSQMLPNIYGTISESGAKTDLQTEGLSSGVFGGGAVLPTVVGPYHYYSAEANLSESSALLRFTTCVRRIGRVRRHC